MIAKSDDWGLFLCGSTCDALCFFAKCDDLKNAANLKNPRQKPDFHCVTITEVTVVKEIKTKKGIKKIEIQMPQTWAELWPDEREREIVMKVNRLNINLKADMVIAVPNEMADKTYMDFSP
ncbi:MAG: hypothetical protein NT116_01825, partial [Candidatus Parcubacteria bacterium]|nr:hypothetical protein [Candidatus Parcubacteria bacterium]